MKIEVSKISQNQIGEFLLFKMIGSPNSIFDFFSRHDGYRNVPDSNEMWSHNFGVRQF